MIRPLVFLSDENLDELLSVGLSAAMRKMKCKWHHSWLHLDWFIYYPCVHELVREYGERYQRKGKHNAIHD